MEDCKYVNIKVNICYMKINKITKFINDELEISSSDEVSDEKSFDEEY